MTYLTNNEIDYERIILEYENKIVKNNNNNLENYKAHFSKAIFYFKNCDYEEAIEEITICIDLDLDKKDYLLRGIFYLEKEEIEDAISDFNDYIFVFSDDYIGYYFRGISNKILENYSEAIRDFKFVIKINKNYIYTYLDLCDVLIQIENYSDALKYYNEIFSIEPNYVKDDNINYNISICFFNIKKYDDSLFFINNIDNNNFNGKMFFHRGNIFYELKRTEDAYKDYENALNNGVEEIYKIIIFFKLNKFEEAIKNLKNYLSKMSNKVFNELLFKEYHNSCYISEKYNILTKFQNGNILVKNIAEILINSTMLNYTKIINTFLELNDSKLDIPKLLSFSEKIDSLKFDNNIDDFDEEITDIIDGLFQYNTIFDFYKLKEFYCSNSKENFFLKLKLDLIGYILYSYTGNIKDNEEYTIIFPFFITLSKTIQDYYISLIKQKEKEKYEAIIKERDKVIADLSHSIKNFIKSVQDPLQNLKKDAKQYSELIDNTLKGTNLIREIVNAMNLSYVGSINDFYEDAQDIYNNSISLKDIIISAIKSAVPNMFDWKYFNDFNYNYFKDDELFNSAQKEWENISKSNEIIILKEYLKTYFFNITIDLINIENLKLSDKRGSALKMMILFQEIILNAIKYTSYLDKDKRDVKIILSKDDNLNFIVINNYKTDIIQKKSGLGHIIVKNFAKLLNTEPIITKDSDLFKIELIIEDLWRIK